MMSLGTKVGVTGHQARDGLDWSWVRISISTVLRDMAPVAEALTSLAVGTDQVFAEEALANEINLKAVIPFADYARCFEGQGLENYRDLLTSSNEAVVLERTGSDQEAFLAASKRIADECDILIAVWDGKPAVSLGGTADVVTYALVSGLPVVHLDPFSRTVRRLSQQPSYEGAKTNAVPGPREDWQRIR